MAAAERRVADADTAVGRRPYVNPAADESSEVTGPQVRVGGAAAEVGDSTVSTRSKPTGVRRRAARGAVLAALGAGAAMAVYYFLAVPAPTPSAAPTVTALVPTTGELIIAVEPVDAEVIIDGRIEKPADDPRFFNDKAFPAGRHQVRVRRKGYAEQTRQVELPPGGRIIRKFELEPLEAELLVRTNPPGAALTLDGLDRDERSPARITGLKSTGSYMVQIRKPPCYAPVEKAVAMEGEPKRELFVELDPIPGACAEKQTPRPPAPVTAPVPATGSGAATAAGPATAPATGTGFLRITSKPPGARVFVNDADAGTTPIIKYEVPAGPARIRVIARDGQSEETTVTVRANEVSTHIAKF
jgi:hypothetical protein